jgi:hypothetical protein
MPRFEHDGWWWVQFISTSRLKVFYVGRAAWIYRGSSATTLQRRVLATWQHCAKLNTFKDQTLTYLCYIRMGFITKTWEARYLRFSLRWLLKLWSCDLWHRVAVGGDSSRGESVLSRSVKSKRPGDQKCGRVSGEKVYTVQTKILFSSGSIF